MTQKNNISLNVPEWEEPLKLTSNLPKVVPERFNPEKLLPICLREFVQSSAKRMDNTPPDFTAVSVIVSAAALIGTNVKIFPKKFDKSWGITPNLWGGCVGEPSTKKTPSIQSGLKLLNNAQESYIDAKNRQLLHYTKVEQKRHKNHVADLEKQLELALENNDKDAAQSIAEQLGKLKPPSTSCERQVLVNDTTCQALGARLNNNPAGVLVLRDELAGWLQSLAQKGQEEARAFYLEAFNASPSPYILDRIGRDNLKIETMTVSILGGMQPSILKPLVVQKLTGVSDDGLFERLIMMCVYPEHNHAKPTDIAEDIDNTNRVKEIFCTLAQLDTANEPIKMNFSESAQELWNEWYEQMLQEEKNLPDSWLGVFNKYPALCAKLAVIFHVINEAEKHSNGDSFSPSPTVDKHELEMAIVWIKYLRSHFKKIMTMLDVDTSLLSAEALLQKLPNLFPSFTKQQLSQKGWKFLVTAKERDEALNALVKHKHIIVQESPRQYLVNPIHQPCEPATPAI